MRVSPDQFERIAQGLPQMGRDPASIRQRVEAMEAILERVFVIPGINRPIGLDSIVGLVPVVGDIVTAAMGALGPSNSLYAVISATVTSGFASPRP